MIWVMLNWNSPLKCKVLRLKTNSKWPLLPKTTPPPPLCAELWMKGAPFGSPKQWRHWSDPKWNSGCTHTFVQFCRTGLPPFPFTWLKNWLPRLCKRNKMGKFFHIWLISLLLKKIVPHNPEFMKRERKLQYTGYLFLAAQMHCWGLFQKEVSCDRCLARFNTLAILCNRVRGHF